MRDRIIWLLLKLAEALDKDAVNRAVMLRADVLRAHRERSDSG